MGILSTSTLHSEDWIALRYAFIFHGGWPKPEEAEAHGKKWGPWMASLPAGGNLAAERFQPTGRFVSGSDGERVLDMPIGKDTIGAWLIIEASSYVEAVANVKGCPILENGGTVEVREVM